MATILVIDDDDLLRRMVARVLSMAGYAVIEARDGREGLSVAHQHQPDLIITDLLMPGQEGMETIMAIRRADPAMKIIAMSGGGQSAVPKFGYLEVAQALGADRTLAKPFMPAELTEAVRQLIG